MGWFRQIKDLLPTVSGVTLGTTQRITLPRDYPREGFIIKVTATLSAAAATIAPEGIFSLIKRIRLTANDGGQQRVIVDCDGLMAMQRHLHWNGSLDTTTSSSFTNAYSTTGAKTFYIPVFFSPNVLNDPTRNFFLQNFPRFNNDPVLELQIGSQADVDTHATPTFAISACTITIIDYKREVVVPNWRFLNTEIVQQQQTFPATVTGFRYQVPVPGYHACIGMRPYTSATALGSCFTNPYRFQVLNTIERFEAFADLQAEDDYSTFGASDGTANNDTIASSLGFIDFLTQQAGSHVVNLDTLLNTNPFTQLGTGPALMLDITGGAGVRIEFLHERIFGDISNLLAVPALIGR